jgi:hypothetical protein
MAVLRVRVLSLLRVLKMHAMQLLNLMVTIGKAARSRSVRIVLLVPDQGLVDLVAEVGSGDVADLEAAVDSVVVGGLVAAMADAVATVVVTAEEQMLMQGPLFHPILSLTMRPLVENGARLFTFVM